MSVAVRRASDVSVGLFSLSVGAVQAVFERFLPGPTSSDPHNESIARHLGRAATGVALVAEARALAAGEAVERMSQRAIDTARQVPVVRDVLVGIDSSMTRWAERGDAELERRQALVTEFATRMVPALIDAFFERVDLAALAARVPLADIVAAIDLDAILEHIDVDAILARVDVEALLARIDADALVSRVDADGLIRRVDVDALLHRIDLGPIVAEVLTEVDVGSIVRESTGSITGDAVDGARLTAMRLDGFVGRVADRILLRGAGDRNADPRADRGPDPAPAVAVGPDQ